MYIKIHRGSNEIGGTCIEVSTKKTTVLLDYGMPLDKKRKKEKLKLKKVKPDAVFISHPHLDHFGHVKYLDKSVPVYMGELSRDIINALA